MQTREAIYLATMGNADWTVQFNHSQESGQTWWTATHPQFDGYLTGMTVEQLWEVWLDHPLVISHILGVLIVTHKPKGGEDVIQE
jgi:hypothetical protein